MSRPAIALPVLVLAVAFAPAIARAQSAQDKADAEALFNAGKAALASGNFADACPKLAASQAKDPAIGTALYLAECYERSGKIASAWAEFHQAEDMATQRRDTRASIAKARAERLVPSRLTIVLAPGAKDVPGLAIKRDGEDVGPALLGLASPVDGGRHAVVASAPGRRSFEWHGEVPDQRGATTVTIPVLSEDITPTATATATATPTTAPPPPTPPTTAPAAPPAETGGGLGGGKIAGLAIAGAGVAAIGVSIALGAVAHGNYDSAGCPTGSDGNAQCPDATSLAKVNDAVTLANVGTGLFIGGCVAAVGGIVLFFVAPKAKPRALTAITPWVGPGGGGALLSGRF